MSENAVAIADKQRELSVVEVKAQVTKIQNLMADLMQEGTHYGQSFQGDTKKNLLKPGADKLCFMFRLRPDFAQDIKDLPNGHKEVLTRCQIFHESGQKIAEGVGLATTMESKYRWRNAGRKCPHCGKEAIIPGKKEYGGGWICFAKKGGCGAKFAEDDAVIAGQQIGKVENTDIADCYNTVLKISKKRAYVDATITACAASDIFSQDADDLDRDADNEPRNVMEYPQKNMADLANEARDEPRNVTEPQCDEAAQLKRLLEEGNLDKGFIRAAESALKSGDINTIRGILKKHSSASAAGRQEPKEINEREEIAKAIGEILCKLDPSQRPYFSKAEIEMEKAVSKGAHGSAELLSQKERLIKELKKREDVFSQPQFEDDIPF